MFQRFLRKLFSRKWTQLYVSWPFEFFDALMCNSVYIGVDAYMRRMKKDRTNFWGERIFIDYNLNTHQNSLKISSRRFCRDVFFRSSKVTRMFKIRVLYFGPHNCILTLSHTFFITRWQIELKFPSFLGARMMPKNLCWSVCPDSHNS